MIWRLIKFVFLHGDDALAIDIGINLLLYSLCVVLKQMYQKFIVVSNGKVEERFAKNATGK